MNLLQRKRVANALLSPSTQQQAMLDNAPVGSVGAPGGLLGMAPTQSKPFGLGGLLGAASFAPGIGDTMGLINDARMYAMDPESRTLPNFGLTALGALPFVPALATVYHGSPHKFDAFDLSKIGTGEGAQAYGHGLYFAESPDVAKSYITAGQVAKQSNRFAEIAYRALEASNQDKGGALNWLQKRLASAPDDFKDIYKGAIENFDSLVDPGTLYTVDLPDEAIAKMLDWDKPLSEQAPGVWDAVNEVAGYKVPGHTTGMSAQMNAFLNRRPEGLSSQDIQRWFSEQAAKAGIPGIRYLDGGSRGAGKGTSNYVVFDDKLPKILKRE